MSKWSHTGETDVWRGLVVQEFGSGDVDAFDYLRGQSRADPEGA